MNIEVIIWLKSIHWLSGILWNLILFITPLFLLWWQKKGSLVAQRATISLLWLARISMFFGMAGGLLIMRAYSHKITGFFSIKIFALLLLLLAHFLEEKAYIALKKGQKVNLRLWVLLTLPLVGCILIYIWKQT